MTIKSTIITASAGSGKTFTITKLLAERIKNGLSPSAFIATTFTVKAADELSRRIRKSLMEEGLVAQAQAVSSALVGTVNSVAAAIVGDYAIDAGLSPELDTLTEEAAKRAFDLACDDIIADAEQLHRGLLQRMGYDKPADAYVHDRTGSFPETVRNIAKAARQNLLSPEQIRESAEASTSELFILLDSIGPVSATDNRGEWATEAIAAFGMAVDSDEGKESGAAKTRRRKFTDLAAKMRRGTGDISWKEWAALPTHAGTNAIKALFGQFEGIDSAIAANPAYRDDVAQMIRLVLATAADALVAYADYKKALGLIDFADQEILALEVIRSSDEVKSAIAETFEVLVVDEFQDTNPIQLALFVELGNLAGEIIWVGDPKQSIYGFRGSDPKLMAAAIDSLGSGDGEVLKLGHSWRSHELPLAFSNELFEATMPPEANVRLTIAPDKRVEHAGGDVRVWKPVGVKGNSNKQWFDAIVGGVASLIREGVSPGDIAVLARTAAHVEGIATALVNAGIPCTGDTSDLRRTREGHAMRAALGYLLDTTDRRSLVELITLLDDHAAHDSWFEQLTSAPDTHSRDALFGEWATDPSLAPLQRLRSAAVNLTPLECVRQVVDALDLTRRIAGWSRPDQRLSMIDTMTGLATEFQDEMRSAGAPVSLGKFLNWYDELEKTPRSTVDPHAVFVDTMHQSKGLEWQAVCVALPKHDFKFTPDGHWVASWNPPTLKDPLGDRYLRFWPAAPAKADAIADAMMAHPAQQQRHLEALDDARRLSYVAMTRAAKHSILCSLSGYDVIDAIHGTDVEITVEPESIAIRRADGTVAAIPALVQDMTWSTVPGDTRVVEFGDDAEARRPVIDSARIHGPAPVGPVASAFAGRLPARVTPSAIVPTGEQMRTADIRVHATLGDALVTRGDRHWERVGEAVHGYLGLPLVDLDAQRRTRAAERLVDAWSVGSHISAATLADVGDRWLTWIGSEYPGARIRTEVPITWRNAAEQIHEGWIDQLIETADGSLVLVDHKTYPGPEPEKHVREKYVGQLSGYADALELAGLGRPKEILVHLPLKGLVVSVRP